MSLTASQRLKRMEFAAKVERAARPRAIEASEAIKKSTYAVLGGRRTGRTYKIPGRKRRYVASAPSEAPSSRLRAFRRGWQPKAIGIIPGVESHNAELGRILSKGTRKMKRRPFVRRIQKRSERTMRKIYRRPYLE